MQGDNRRQRIYNPSKKINDEDRRAIGSLLLKAGYCVKIGKTKEGNKQAYEYFVEYWRED